MFKNKSVQNSTSEGGESRADLDASEHPSSTRLFLVPRKRISIRWEMVTPAPPAAGRRVLLVQNLQCSDPGIPIEKARSAEAARKSSRKNCVQQFTRPCVPSTRRSQKLAYEHHWWRHRPSATINQLRFLSTLTCGCLSKTISQPSPVPLLIKAYTASSTVITSEPLVI